MMREATRNRARMWGSSIVGYGSYDYEYPSGRSGSFMSTGFSPRARNLATYLMPGFSSYDKLLKKLEKPRLREATSMKLLVRGMVTADAVCIGRPYLWGLASFGQAGVERALELLQNELRIAMQFAGTPSLDAIGPDAIGRHAG